MSDKVVGSSAATESSAAAWRKWFELVDSAATPEVINATANLVITEREIFMRPYAERIAQLEVWVSELRHKAGITEVDEVYERMMADM